MPDRPGSQQDAEVSQPLANLQADFETLKAELEHSQRLASLGVLAAGIAHEINNTLTPVLAYAQLALNHPDDPAMQAKALERTVHGVQTATRIAEAILGFASQGERDGSQEDVAELRSVVHNAFNCIGRDPERDGIKVTLDLPGELQVRIRPLALQQVLVNLILNARAAMLRSARRGGSLTISASCDHMGMAMIEVHDTGPGIPEEIAGRLFQPFVSSRTVAGRLPNKYRSDMGDAAGGGGTGLGLSICRRLIDDAGGSISASSRQGHGTTFTIRLPSVTRRRAKAG